MKEVSGTLATIIADQLNDFFAAHETGINPGTGLHTRIIQEVERPLIRATLAFTKGNKLQAAHILGINRNTLHKKMVDLGLTTDLQK